MAGAAAAAAAVGVVGRGEGESGKGRSVWWECARKKGLWHVHSGTEVCRLVHRHACSVDCAKGNTASKATRSGVEGRHLSQVPRPVLTEVASHASEAKDGSPICRAPLSTLGERPPGTQEVHPNRGALVPVSSTPLLFLLSFSGTQHHQHRRSPARNYRD